MPAAVAALGAADKEVTPVVEFERSDLVLFNEGPSLARASRERWASPHTITPPEILAITGRSPTGRGMASAGRPFC